MDFDELWKAMLAAMEKPLGSAWSRAKDFAETESKKIAHSVIVIGEHYALPDGVSGKITKEQAFRLLRIQKLAAEEVLIASAAIAEIAAEKAVAAGLGAIRDVVNKAIGFPLL